MPLDGGAKLDEALKKISSRLSTATMVEVGFIDGATYPDGTSVAMVATTQEFGGTINLPEREQTIYRKVDKAGDFTRNGKFVKKAQSNFETTHTVAAHTVTIPPRPFFRNMIAKQSPEWPEFLRKALKRTGYDAASALGLLGQHIQEQLQDSIRSNTPPPNAPSTVAAKGFDRTLIHTGTMLNSVTHNVK